MEFNPDTTKQATEVLFSCKKIKPNQPSVIFNGYIVQKTSEQKYLGLILDSSLIMAKRNNIGIIKYLSKFLPFKALNQMYKACSFPYRLLGCHLSYTTFFKSTICRYFTKLFNGRS